MFFIVMILIIGIFITVFEINSEQKYKKLESEVLNELGFSDWQIISYIDKFNSTNRLFICSSFRNTVSC